MRTRGVADQAFAGIRAGLPPIDRSSSAISAHFLWSNRAGSTVSHGLQQSFWLQGMSRLQVSLRMRQSIFRDRFHEEPQEVRRADAHSARADDQIGPIDGLEFLSAKLVKGAELKVYSGRPTGCVDIEDRVQRSSRVYLIAQ